MAHRRADYSMPRSDRLTRPPRPTVTGHPPTTLSSLVMSGRSAPSHPRSAHSDGMSYRESDADGGDQKKRKKKAKPSGGKVDASKKASATAAKKEQVRNWLNTIDLGEYTDTFFEWGFDDLTFLQTVADLEELNECCGQFGMLAGHAMRLISALKKLRAAIDEAATTPPPASAASFANVSGHAAASPLTVAKSGGSGEAKAEAEVAPPTTPPAGGSSTGVSVETDPSSGSQPSSTVSRTAVVALAELEDPLGLETVCSLLQ